MFRILQFFLILSLSLTSQLLAMNKDHPQLMPLKPSLPEEGSALLDTSAFSKASNKKQIKVGNPPVFLHVEVERYSTQAYAKAWVAMGSDGTKPYSVASISFLLMCEGSTEETLINNYKIDATQSFKQKKL